MNFIWTQTRDSFINLHFNGREPKTDKAAMRISLAKWRETLRRLATIEPDELDGVLDFHNGGPMTCGLCMLYNHNGIPQKNRCHNCPIHKKTKRRYCDHTPAKKFEAASSCHRAERLYRLALSEYNYLARMAEDYDIKAEPMPKWSEAKTFFRGKRK